MRGCGDYFELVSAWNARLHLVAPCAPAEFATRHVLESLAALPFLPEGATFVDVGSGAGLPVTPLPRRAPRPDGRARRSLAEEVCLSARGVVDGWGWPGARRVVAERFEKTEPPAAERLTCRAIERFTEILPALVAWAARVPVLLLFGGESLRERLERRGTAISRPFNCRSRRGDFCSSCGVANRVRTACGSGRVGLT